MGCFRIMGFIFVFKQLDITYQTERSDSNVADFQLAIRLCEVEIYLHVCVFTCSVMIYELTEAHNKLYKNI